jgi:autotransporter-associated beta strand protein
MTLVHFNMGAVGTQTDPTYDSTTLTTQLDPTNVPTMNGSQIVEGGDNEIGGAGDSTIALKTATTGSPPNYPCLQAYAGNSAINSSTASGTAITTALQAETNNCYFTFTVSGMGTNTLNLASLTFNGQNGGSGLRGFSIQESVDGFSTNGTTDFVPQTTNATYRGEAAYGSAGSYSNYSYSLTASKFQGLSNITFRIFVFGPGTSSSIEFDDIELNGTVVGTMTSTPQNDVWVGNLSTNWDLSGALNWTTNGAATGNYGFNNGDTVIFNDSAASFPVNVATNVSPASITVSNNLHNYVFSSVGTFTGNAIANGTPLTKIGTGTLKLGMITQFGATAVSNGVIDLGGNNQTVGLLSGSGVITNATSGAGMPILTIGSGAGSASPYYGLFVGSMGISQVGVGLVLANTNTYTGPTTNAAGTLQVSGASGLGNSSGVTITGGVLTLTNATVSSPIAFSPSGVAEPLLWEGPSAVNTISGPVTIADGAAYTVEADSVAGVSTGAYLYFTGGIFADTNSVLIVDDNSGNSDPGNVWIQTTPMNLGSGWLKGFGWHINVSGNIVGTINPYYGRSASLNVDNAFSNVPALLMGAPASVSVTYGKLNLNGHNLTVSSLTSVGTASTSDEVTSSNNAFLDVSNTSTCTYVGILTGAGLGLVKDGTGTLILGNRTNFNTYAGSTTIKAGTLALTNSVTITNSANITIDAGATFDVSGIANGIFSLGTGQTLAASGTVSAATINGASGGMVGLGSQAIKLTYDGSHPALYISQGTLTLNGNVFTVNTTNGLPLPTGTYTVIQQASGNITSSGSYTVSGNAIGSGDGGYISVAGGNVNLMVYQPVAMTMTSYRTAGTTLKVPLSDMATNWSDTGGYPVSLTGINLTTTNGQTLWLLNVSTNNGSFVISSASFVGYTNGPNVADKFSYSIADNNGATNIGQVNIVIVGSVSGQATGLINPGGNAVTVNYAGLPGYAYSVQRSTNLVIGSGWVTIWITNVPANGLFNYTDSFSGLGGVPQTAYYRLSWQP